ncbi:hypothetical protein M426DRAFT_22428 [Hypoxylon sp. CI-4A]|nr:hypothetical protein M426DRAFT_22428 [Hypoxylon sp. CI-4A]
MSDGSDTYDSEYGALIVAARIKTYFDHNHGYQWEDTIGAGANGVVYRIRNRVPGNTSYEGRPVPELFALKIAPHDVVLETGNKSYDEDGSDLEDEVNGLDNERKWLWQLRGCPHIIESLNIPHDPLARAPPQGTLAHRMRAWVYTEYVENGIYIMGDQYQTAYYGDSLCVDIIVVVRACVEMAYHSQANMETIALDSLSSMIPGNLAHLDLAQRNVALGSMYPSLQHPEHSFTPILKALDFGTAEMRDGRSNGRNGPQENIFDIGRLMAYIILQDQPVVSRAQVTVNGNTFNTFAKSLHDQRGYLIQAGVDADLIDIVYHCCADDMTAQPQLLQLATTVRDRVANRGHGGIAHEQDQNITERIRNVVYTPIN